MPVVTKKIPLKTRGESQIIDITAQFVDAVAQADLSDGVATVFIPGATGAVTTVEYEPGLLEDLGELFERLAPRHGRYAHNKAWGDDNGYAHVRATLLGPSLSVPFSGGKPVLGRWQSVIFIDFDNRPRDREIIVQIMGE